MSPVLPDHRVTQQLPAVERLPGALGTEDGAVGSAALDAGCLRTTRRDRNEVP